MDIQMDDIIFHSQNITSITSYWCKCISIKLERSYNSKDKKEKKQRSVCIKGASNAPWPFIHSSPSNVLFTKRILLGSTSPTSTWHNSQASSLSHWSLSSPRAFRLPTKQQTSAWFSAHGMECLLVMGAHVEHNVAQPALAALSIAAVATTVVLEMLTMYWPILLQQAKASHRSEITMWLSRAHKMNNFPPLLVHYVSLPLV